MKICIVAVTVLASIVPVVNAFVPSWQSAQQPQLVVVIPKLSHVTSLRAAADEEEKKENPYQDPNYPDLEFVNYDDPEYQVDQGVSDEFIDPESTEAQIEAMREERRMRNDEFQFETYYKDVLRNGEEYKGEWTIFQTSTFLIKEEEMPAAYPKLKKAGEPFKVYSKGKRIEIESSDTAQFRLENQRLVHDERLFQDSGDSPINPEDIQKLRQHVVNTKHGPEQLSSNDFRGHQGNMCVGNGFTVATAMSLNDGTPAQEGPFSEYRTELGIQADQLRFRVKLDYAEVERKDTELPPLHLRTMTLCRETLGMWPRADNYKSAIEALTDIAFFGPAGASGGLYDPPPVGSEVQAGQYMKLDLEGGATLLLPYLIDQDPSVHPDMGWVTSLDWSPGPIRFQVDRKINGGQGILGLRTLELSEVQSADAETYRPKDGGEDMRQ
jgi:hypothetical protein